MGDMDKSIKKILEIVTDTQEEVSDMRKQMATKEDLKGMATKDDVRGLRSQISENTRAIAEMAEQLRGVFGYAKEIDALMTRVREKHVGLAK